MKPNYKDKAQSRAAPYIFGLALACVIVLVLRRNEFYAVVFAWSVFSGALGFFAGAIWYAKKYGERDDDWD